MGKTDDQPHTNHSTMIAVTYCTDFMRYWL